MGAVPPNLGTQWAQWEGVVDLKQWDDFIFLANPLGSEVSRVKVKWMRVKNEIPPKKSCKTNLPGLEMFLILDLQPTCGMTRHGSKLSRPKLVGCHWRNAEIQKLSLFTQLVGITIFAG